MAQSNSSPPARPRWVLKRLDQVAAAAVIAASLAALGGFWLWQGHLRGRMVEIDRAEPIAVQFQLDINQADWPDCSSLEIPEA